MLKLTKYHTATAAEAIAAAQFARLGCNVAVQYGANQPEYDLTIDDGSRRPLCVSVKGIRGKSWPLAASLKKNGVSYHGAIDAWVEKHRVGTVICLVSFLDVKLDVMPPVFLAQPAEIADVMKAHGPAGHGALHLADVPDKWKLTPERLAIFFAKTLTPKFAPGDLVTYWENEDTGLPCRVDEVDCTVFRHQPGYKVHAVKRDDPSFAGEPIYVRENTLEPL